VRGVKSEEAAISTHGLLMHAAHKADKIAYDPTGYMTLRAMRHLADSFFEFLLPASVISNEDEESVRSARERLYRAPA
jgi:hypothetical protein